VLFKIFQSSHPLLSSAITFWTFKTLHWKWNKTALTCASFFSIFQCDKLGKIWALKLGNFMRWVVDDQIPYFDCRRTERLVIGNSKLCNHCASLSIWSKIILLSCKKSFKTGKTFSHSNWNCFTTLEKNIWKRLWDFFYYWIHDTWRIGLSMEKLAWYSGISKATLLRAVFNKNFTKTKHICASDVTWPLPCFWKLSLFFSWLQPF